MGASDSRGSDFYYRVRVANKQLWVALNALVAEQRQWNALDYGSTLLPGEGTNEGLVAADVGAVVFDTANAIAALLATGHATNMAKLL